MIEKLVYLFIFSFLFISCKKNEQKTSNTQTSPILKNNGTAIVFPDTAIVSFFKTEKVNTANIEAELTAPGKIAATIVSSSEGASQNIILFDNPELASNYTQIIQHQISIAQQAGIIRQKQGIIQQKDAIIKQKQVELARFKDLATHGVATGKEVADAQTDLLIAETERTSSQTDLQVAQTELSNAKAGIIEHESILKSGGFNPEILRRAKVGTAYIICEIPENQIEEIKVSQSCNIIFTAFPNQKFIGKIDAVADVVDHTTRMMKLRILVTNATNLLKAGMFANVSFGLSEANFINISKNSLVTIQGKQYVFIKKSSNEFERKEIQIGQQIGDRIIVFNGLANGTEIATEGVMQLKGLSFGY